MSNNNITDLLIKIEKLEKIRLNQLKANKKYYEKNKDKIAKHSKEYYIKNKDTYLNNNRKWRNDNKDILNEKARIRCSTDENYRPKKL